MLANSLESSGRESRGYSRVEDSGTGVTRIRYISTVDTRVQAYASAAVKTLGKNRKLSIERRLGVLRSTQFGRAKGHSMSSYGEEFPWVMKALVLRDHVC